MTKSSSIFEVSGEHPNFERNIQRCPPDLLEGFLHTLYVGLISKDDINTVKQIADNVFVDNETFEWDCQEYVLDEDDEDYRDAREILKDKRGAIL